MTRTWKQTLLATPGIGIALLPKLLCPFCWPLYAGIVSSIGLGFLVGTTYLVPITGAFLAVTLAVLGFRARQRRGYGPLLLGLVASASVLLGKFYFESAPATYGGIAALVVATFWNAWPLRIGHPSETLQINGIHQERL